MVQVRPSHKDFSGGQINASARRRDDLDLVKSAARVATNLLARQTGQARARFGRRARFVTTGSRVERVRMTANDKYYLDFSAGALTIRDENGGSVALNMSANYLWTADTLRQVSWVRAFPDIVICFPNMRPQVASWNSISKAWTFGQFSFLTRNNTKYAPFVRTSVPTATMTPSATTGSITLTCSADYFLTTMVGRVISLMGRQVTITAVTDARTATATVAKQLADWVRFSLTDTPGFNVTEVAVTETTKQKIEIGTVSAGVYVEGTLMHSLNLSATTVADTLIGESGSARITGFATTAAAQPILQWTEEFMGEGNWPAVCFFAQNRLGFGGFPLRPDAQLWSSVNAYSSFWIDVAAVGWTQNAGTNAASAILEYCKDNAAVKYAVDYGDILLFTDRGVYQIPVSTTNPFKPGSIEYRKITNDICADVAPVAGPDLVLYMNEGKKRVSAILATGAASRSFTSSDLTEAHSDLLNAPVAMAIAAGDENHPERLIYLVNSDGSVVAGRFIDMSGKTGVGWFPWTEVGTTKWVTMADEHVEFVSAYAGANIMQIEDDDLWLDAAVYYNSIPSNLASGGLGRLWWLAGRTVTLMDGRLDRGDRTVSAAGALVPVVGEDLSSLTLAVGLPYTCAYQPFVPNLGGGEDKGQRKNARKVSEIVVTANHSNGFSCRGRAVPGLSFGDSADVEPDYRESVEMFAGLGRAHDPVIEIQTERPGPFELIEVSYKVSV